MAILATITATTMPGSGVDIEARGASSGGTGYYLADIEATVDASVYEALRPRGGVQRVGVRVYLHGWSDDGPVDGDGLYRIDPWLTGGWSVNRSLGQVSQGAQLSLAATNGETPLGSQMATPAMLSVGRPWDIKLAYRYGDDGAQEFPLISWARVESSERSDNGPVVDSLRLVDDTWGYRGFQATYQLPAGHGLTYGQASRKLWHVAAGSTDEALARVWVPSIPGDFQFRKELNLLKGDALALLGAIGDLCGVHYFINEDRYLTGALYAPELPPETRPLAGVIDERDIIVAVDGQPETFTIRPMPAPPTHVCFSGTVQLVKTATGRRSVPYPYEDFATFAPKVMPFIQNGAGVLTPTGLTETVRDGKSGEGATFIDFDADEPVGIQNFTREYHNPSTARYTNDADLDLTPIAGVYVEENSDGALAFAWGEQRLIDLSFGTQSREFDASNNLSREIQETWAIHHQRRAIQSRPNLNTAWENTAGAPGIVGFMLGNGEGVVTAQASLQRTELKIIEYSSDRGYKVAQTTSIYKWHVREAGWQYRYGDGKTSSDPQETFRRVSYLKEKWLAIQGDESRHVYVWAEYGPDGSRLRGKIDTLQGYLPQAEEKNDPTPQLDDYESAAEWALAVAASRHDNQPMHAELHDDAAVDALGRHRVDAQATYELAQALWQLENAAKRLFIKGRARVVSFSVPPNPLFRIGQWWRVRNRKPGVDVDHDGIILDSQFEQRGNRGAIVQRLSVAVH